MASTHLRVRTFQRKLYVASKQKKDYRFYSLYDKVYRPDILMEAYRQCRSNGGSPGCDGETFKAIEARGLEPWLETLSIELRNRTYKHQPVRRVYIEKPGQPGKFRPLGIPTIRDRVVQGACKIVIEPVFEADLNDGSYGYRPKRGAADAVKRIEQSIREGYVHIYDADLSGYFDHIPHKELMEKIKRRIRDKQMLSLLKMFLQAPVLSQGENGRSILSKPVMGSPQGGVISPLYANIYLNDFSQLINTRTPCRMISYADDFVIMHKAPYTERQLKWFRDRLASEGLTINEAKTHVVDMSRKGSQFDFLGFAFRIAPSLRWKGSRYLRVEPAKKSRHRFKEAIREIVKHRTSFTLEQLIARVNPIIRGWKNYFAQCGSPIRAFFQLDWFIVARFHRWAKRLSQRGSKYLTLDTLNKLRKKGLELLTAKPLRAVKGAS